MMDENNKPTEGAETSQAGEPNTQSAERENAQSSPKNEGQDKARLYAKARREFKAELLQKWGASSLEEVSAIMSDVAKARQEAEQAKLVEQQKKEELAKRLIERETELKQLSEYRERYGKLRESLKHDRLSAAALRAGVLSDAVDIAVMAINDVAEWDGDELRFRTLDGAGEHENADALFAELKKAKPFLFSPPQRVGSGVLGGSLPRTERATAVKTVNVTDAMNWGRTPQK